MTLIDEEERTAVMPISVVLEQGLLDSVADKEINDYIVDDP